MVDRFKQFSFSIFEIYRCWHKLAAEVMIPYGLRGPHAIYLVALRDCENGLTAVELSTICGRDKADVSRAISSMQEKGLITRDSVNNYRAKVKLTNQGIAVVELISRRIAVAVEYAAQGYESDQRAVFYQVLDAVTDNLRQLSKTGLPEE